MMIDLINYKFNIFCINESHIFFFIFQIHSYILNSFLLIYFCASVIY